VDPIQNNGNYFKKSSHDDLDDLEEWGFSFQKETKNNFSHEHSSKTKTIKNYASSPTCYESFHDKVDKTGNDKNQDNLQHNRKKIENTKQQDEKNDERNEDIESNQDEEEKDNNDESSLTEKVQEISLQNKSANKRKEKLSKDKDRYDSIFVTARNEDRVISMK
jgi:hypothetical protein